MHLPLFTDLSDVPTIHGEQDDIRLRQRRGKTITYSIAFPQICKSRISYSAVRKSLSKRLRKRWNYSILRQ